MHTNQSTRRFDHASSTPPHDMTTHTAPSMRVLTRPPPAPSSIPQQPLPFPNPNPTTTTSGVVVVGFISLTPDSSTHLINRVLDRNSFGSGCLDKTLTLGPDSEEEFRDWFKTRRIGYYYEEEKGLLYLQFCSTQCPVRENVGLEKEEGREGGLGSGFDSFVEEREFGDMQGLLFMFSVCHIIIYIFEGSHFDPQILKRFRVLQAAKHALTPFVRSKAVPGMPSKPHSSSLSQPMKSPATTDVSPGRSRIMGRSGSAISLMSGLGSYASLFPGQCTPVVLFVFVDDYLDASSTNSNMEEATDNSLLNASTNLSGMARSKLPAKTTGSVVVLARPTSKSEGGFKKKLQASLEAQIRFLIKKCRTLSGSETTLNGSRSAGASSSAPLFLLDASRAVLLLDRSTNQRGESLEFAIGLVEDVLNGKATLDSLLLESHSQNANNGDMISIKEFIFRQADVLRGRGAVVTSNSGSAAGVGMVAVAAAAAAASAASGKTSTAPELPNLASWLSSSKIILHGILTGKRGYIDETEINKRRHRQRDVNSTVAEGIAPKGTDPLNIAVSWLERGKGMNRKFSTSWCQKALPAAKDVYLKDLPACYPTSQHEIQLDKALHAFHSMVKGPSVEHFAKILEDECVSIWRSGRQLCDAISLTGKPCMHQRHVVEAGDLLVGDSAKPHSSGYVFLHACACGRSRQLQADPFDFESANIVNCLPNCDKLLPAFQLPDVPTTEAMKPSLWSLIRLGSSRYYEPYKGLLQSGFFASQKFLLKWIIRTEKQMNTKGLLPLLRSDGALRSGLHPETESTSSADIDKSNVGKSYGGTVQTGIGNPTESKNILPDNRKISFGRGLPNVSMKKPFSEVVAGSAAAGSGFPPLQQRKHTSALVPEKVMKQSSAEEEKTVESIHANADYEGKKGSKDISTQETSSRIGSGDPFLRIGRNVISINMNGNETIKTEPLLLNHAVAYVGFEHECPRGHRFILNPKHLKELGPLYSSPDEVDVNTPDGTFGCGRAIPPKFSENELNGKGHSGLSVTAFGGRKGRNLNKSKDINSVSMCPNASLKPLRQGKEYCQASDAMPRPPDLLNDFSESLHSISHDSARDAVLMLNRNLPIYMSCPHCKHSKRKDVPKFNFASTVSQLQRIFMVSPPFPVVLATCPVIQFETSCLPSSIHDRERKLEFSIGCQVILPPESFLVLRLPFVYGVQLEDQNLHPLNPFEHQPECTAWIKKGTALRVLSKCDGFDKNSAHG